MHKRFSAVTATFAIASLPLCSAAAVAIPAAKRASAHNALQLVHQGHDHVHAMGTVNSVDEAGRKVKLSHGPIPQIGWPAMTMDFPVAPSVDLKAIRPGTRVEFTLERGSDGMFQVESLKPISGGQ